MPTITVTVDERTDEQLDQLSAEEKIPVSEVALRLLRRALRTKRPKNTWDVVALREHATFFAEEDSLIAEADLEHRSSLLHAEDTMP